MDAAVQVDLQSWKRCLINGRGRFVQSKQLAIIVPTWGNGNGSGTGTGDTFLVPDGALKMWKRKWNDALVSCGSLLLLFGLPPPIPVSFWASLGVGSPWRELGTHMGTTGVVPRHGIFDGISLVVLEPAPRASDGLLIVVEFS
jgi:hypothetical protein